jgi:hypothetical protein
VARTVWDRARVEKAKLTTNAKYQESPQQMMVARGQAEICRQIAADALHGIAYAVEETEYFEAEAARAVEPRRRLTAAEVMGDAPVSAVVVERPEPADEPTQDAPAETAEPITKPQQAKLHACLNELGWGERAKGLEEISRILKEPIASTKDLTKTEAMHVIDVLESTLHSRRQTPPANNHVADSQVSP